MIKEILLLPRKPLSAPERHLCPPAMQKNAIKPNPQLDPWDHRFWVPLHSPICSLSLLFSTNKIFLTSAVGVHLCFHPQSGLKNPEHLKFLLMSSMHQKQEYP
jgi:hypothetical protein